MSRLISERQQMLQIEKEENERRDRGEDASTSSSSSSDSSSSDSDTEEEHTPPSPTRRRTHMLAQERSTSIRHGNSRNTTNLSNRNRGDGTVVVPSRIPNRTQPVPIWTPPDFDRWSAEKQRLWRNLAKAPAAFYYKYCPPGVARIETPWTAAERVRFLELVETRPCGKEWGYLAMHMPGRTGQMCELFFKQLQEEKKTGVKAGQVLPPLPLEAAPLPTKSIPIVTPAALPTPPTTTIVKTAVVPKPSTPATTVKAVTPAAPEKALTTTASTTPAPSNTGVRAPASTPAALPVTTTPATSAASAAAMNKAALPVPAAAHAVASVPAVVTPSATTAMTANASLAATVAAVAAKAATTANTAATGAAVAATEDDSETTSSSSSSSSSDSDTDTDSDNEETEDEQVTLSIPSALSKTPSAPSTTVTRPLQARASVPLPAIPSSLPKGVLAPAALLADGRLRATASTAVHKVELSPSAIGLLPIDANTLPHTKTVSTTPTPAPAAPLPAVSTPVTVPVTVPVVAPVASVAPNAEAPSTPTAVTPAVTPIAPGAPTLVRTRARTDAMPRRDTVVRNLAFDGISVDNSSQDDDNNTKLVSTRVAGTSLFSPTASAFLISAAADCSIVSQSALRGEYAPVPTNGYNPTNTRLKARSTGPPTRSRAVIAKKTRPAATVTIDVTVPVTLSFSAAAADAMEEARVPVAVTTRVTVPKHTSHAQVSLLNDQHAIALSRFAAQIREKKRKTAALAVEYEKNMEEYEEVKRQKREVTATESTIRATRANPDAHAKARSLMQTQGGQNPTIFGYNNVPNFEMEDSVNHRNPISLNDYCYKLYSQFDAHKYSVDPVMSNTDQANYVYNTRTKFLNTTRAPAMPASRPMFAPRQQVNLWENLAGTGIPTSQCPIPVTTKLESAYTSNIDMSTIVADAGHYAVAYQAISSLHERGYLSGVAVDVNTQ